MPPRRRGVGTLSDVAFRPSVCPKPITRTDENGAFKSNTNKQTTQCWYCCQLNSLIVMDLRPLQVAVTVLTCELRRPCKTDNNNNNNNSPLIRHDNRTLLHELTYNTTVCHAGQQ